MRLWQFLTNMTFLSLQKRRRFHFEHFGKPVDHVDASTVKASLKGTDIGPVYSRVERQPLLRTALAVASRP